MNSAELETVRVSKSPTTVVTAKGEVHTKRRSGRVCQRIIFIRDSKASRRYTGCSLTRKTLPRSRITDILTSGPLARSHNSSKMADGQNANRRPWVIDPASTRSESSSSTVWRSPSHEPAETEKKQIKMDTTRTYGEARCLICQNVWNILQKIWWMNVFQLTGTHPRVLHLNQLQSRECKWNRARVSTIFILTSRRTKFAKFASEPRLQGLLAENSMA